MTPRTKTKLSLAFHAAMFVGGAGVIWWLGHMLQQDMLKPRDYEAMKNEIVQKEFQRATRAAFDEKMQACLSDYKSKAGATGPFACASDVQIDTDKIMANADEAVLHSKTNEPRVNAMFEKMKWGMPMFFILMLLLAHHGTIRQDIRALRGPAVKPE